MEIMTSRLMMFKKNSILNVVILIFCAGCALADLRPQALHSDELPLAAQKQGQEILDASARELGISANWNQVKTWEIEATDVWKNKIFRHLTPIKQPEQKFKMTIDLTQENTKMVFLDGKFKNDVIGIDQSGSYRITKQKRTNRRYGDVLLYLPHVRSYFLWPEVLRTYPLVAYAGEGKMGKEMYDKVFVTKGNILPHFEDNQYIVWVNRQNKRIDYIEFTLRDLLGSLHGVVGYRDYHDVQGMQLPFEVILLDRMDGEKYSHKLVVERMSFQ